MNGDELTIRASVFLKCHNMDQHFQTIIYPWVVESFSKRFAICYVSPTRSKTVDFALLCCVMVQGAVCQYCQ